jgi:hypothetical protein
VAIAFYCAWRSTFIIAEVVSKYDIVFSGGHRSIVSSGVEAV